MLPYKVTLTGPNVPTRTEILKSESKEIIKSSMRQGMASKVSNYYGYTKAKIELMRFDGVPLDDITEIIQTSSLNDGNTIRSDFMFTNANFKSNFHQVVNPVNYTSPLNPFIIKSFSHPSKSKLKKVKKKNIKQLELLIVKTKKKIKITEDQTRQKIYNYNKLIALQLADIYKLLHDEKCTKKIVLTEKSGHECKNHYTCLVCGKVHGRGEFQI